MPHVFRRRRGDARTLVNWWARLAERDAPATPAHIGMRFRRANFFWPATIFLSVGGWGTMRRVARLVLGRGLSGGKVQISLILVAGESAGVLIAYSPLA